MPSHRSDRLFQTPLPSVIRAGVLFVLLGGTAALVGADWEYVTTMGGATTAEGPTVHVVYGLEPLHGGVSTGTGSLRHGIVPTLMSAPPEAADDSLATSGFEEVRIPVGPRAADPEGRGVTLVEVQTGDQGVAEIDGDDSRFVPLPDGSTDNATIRYRVVDGEGQADWGVLGVALSGWLRITVTVADDSGTSIAQDVSASSQTGFVPDPAIDQVEGGRSPALDGGAAFDPVPGNAPLEFTFFDVPSAIARLVTTGGAPVGGDWYPRSPLVGTPVAP